MAAPDALALAVNDPVLRLSQYLFVGKEFPDYQPGNWFVHDYFLAKNVPSIEELAEDVKNQLLPIELITKAFESNVVPHPETLVFALAVCCRQTKSETLRHAAYTSVKKICSSPENFILFIKFASSLCKQKELDQNGKGKQGWGHGLRKAVNNWYLSKDPMELAKCVTRYRGRYGWKHKDIVKLSHPVPNSLEKEVILMYIVHGLADAKKAFENKSEAQNILQYIQQVKEFKHCQDKVEAAALIEMHKLTLEHVPAHMLKSEETWNSLIPTMDLITLLNNLQRIHNLGLLKPHCPTVTKIVDQITNVNNLANDNIHPALILITIRNYENCGKPLSFEKRKIKEQAKSPLPTPLKPNIKIVDTLYKALNLSFTHLQPTGLRYMITINMNKVMLENRAWRSGNVNGAEAGCMIALALLRCEKNVTVAIFKNVEIHTVNIDKSASFDQALRRLQQMPVGIVNLSKPMLWATHQNNEYDVFINVVDQIFEKCDTYEEALETYRVKLKLPQAKLINCAVCSSTTYHKEHRDKNILTIHGFDATVPMVIEAFSKSLF